jgi:hypothetical protein
VALSVSCQSLSNGNGRQTTNKNPNPSTARLIVDFINTIDPMRTFFDVNQKHQPRDGFHWWIAKRRILSNEPEQGRLEIKRTHTAVPGIGKTRLSQRTLKCVLSIGPDPRETLGPAAHPPHQQAGQ